ncbi:phasin family protein [Natronocella acetinitrilica]|uniref:Phasin family protein n=1 Tax=Natronocella acetinitrilica TaxID=414046 RepID=A0AAE3G281_9GAMM|nr:phasin family protein [Natronocella acetinitrilica]
MYAELFSKTTDQMQQLMAPARKMQEVMVEHVARLADFQMDSMKQYSEMTIGQLRSLQDVKSPEDFQQLMSGQSELLKGFTEQMSTDISELTKLQRDLSEELQKLSQESMSSYAEGARKQARQAVSTAKKSA